MPSPSKEERLLELILGTSQFKEWHFEELVRESKLTRAIVNKWLKKYESECLISRVKLKGKFPYFIVKGNNPVYLAKKKFYAMEKIYRSGLVKELLSLSEAKTVILFGSFAKGDWYKDSDVDIFILGGISGFDKSVFEEKLKKRI